jgi:predicted enzyme related to lactoylglutathione lyase
MNEGLKTILYPVKDIAQAKSLYTRLLGVQPDTDSPYYVGFTVGGQHVGLLPQGHSQGMTSPVGYWHVDDIRKCVEHLVDAGAKTQQEVKDVGKGRLVASVIDSDGNVIGLIEDP